MVKDVLISPYSPYLLNAARRFPRAVLQLYVGFWAPGSGRQEPGLRLGSRCDPGKAPPAQGPAREPQGEVLLIHSAQLGSVREVPSSQREATRGDPTWPPRAPQVLHPPSAPGSRKSLPSPARSPQPLAVKMSRQAYVAASEKHGAGQTHSPKPSEEWVMATHRH